MSDIRIYKFGPLRSITTCVVILIGVKLVVLALHAGIGAYALAMGHPIDYDKAGANDLDSLALITDLFDRIVFVVSGTVSLIWIYHAAGNTRSLSMPTMKPAWAVAWFFIPLLGLYKPYEYVRDIWASAQALQGDRVRRDALPVTMWWCFFLGGNALVIIGREISDPAGALYTVVGCVLSWIATVFFLVLVRNVSALQNSADVRLAEEAVSNPS